MGIGFKLNLKWDFSVKSPFFINSSPGSSSYSFRGREASYDSARVSFPSVISGESETLHNDPLRAHTCSSSPQTLENDYSETEGIKMNISRRSHGGLYNVIDDNIQMSHGGDKLTFLTSLQAYKASHFSLLMKNLDTLEDMFDDSDVVRLERDIMAQLERLGALKLFRIFLSRSLKAPDMVDSAHTSTEFIEETQMNDSVDNQAAMIVVRTGKKEERKTRRQKASENANNLYAVALPSKTNKHHKQLNFSSVNRSSNSRGRRLKIARNEVEMARGVKILVNLERIRTVLEKESGQVATLSSWAEAAELNKKELQENLHYGWYCRDELLRSTRSLVLYLARNYRGVGVAFEDLIQAGNFGVMQGAERFDHTRGYKFSTYVQYWIRKSMSILVTQHARGIRIPFTLSKAINQIQKARKVLNNIHGKYPGDDEIAKLTGLSLTKITSASKCMRVVGSLDQKVGEFTSAKFLELTPDKSIKSPEESIARQHMIKDIYALLNCLDPRERQVLVLRFGLGDHQRKSLEEIGRLFNVSKEWIRKIERTALTKLRDEETCRNLSHYLYM